jgi:hypothetical protein
MSPVHYFLIHGPIQNELPTYWYVGLQSWMPDIDLASKFPHDILSLPLPQGAEGVMEYTPSGLFFTWFAIVPPPWAWFTNSQNNG